MNLKDASVKKETGSENKGDRQTYSRTFMTFVAIISIVIVLGLVISSIDSNSKQKEAEELKKMGIVSTNFESTYSFYESRTSIQKNEYWESIKGKKVQWSGTVSEVRSAFLSSKQNVMIVAIKPGLEFKTVFLKDIDLTSINKGQSITIRGTLSSQWELSDAEIIKK